MKNRPTGDELAEIVHDLRSPLAAISLEAELLGDRIEHHDRAELVRAAQRISLNAGFLDRMIQDLLDLSALEEDLFVLHRAPTELRSLVERVLQRVIATRDHSRISLFGVDRLVLDVDENRLERVIANLVTNAFQYGPKSARVTVRIERYAEHVCISVTDAGGGVSDQERAVIFDKFRRGNTPTRGGTGLGLYVSKRIVEAHGGWIGVDRLGGSRFFVELPLAQLPEAGGDSTHGVAEQEPA